MLVGEGGFERLAWFHDQSNFVILMWCGMDACNAKEKFCKRDRVKFCVDCEGELVRGSFVETLVKEGGSVVYDESQGGCGMLPDFYDEEKFKRGQKFYHEHIFAMFFAKLLGLVLSLAYPKASKFLKFTNKSSEPKTAYRRYLSTIFHMVIWYEEGFHPGGRLWNSIAKVNQKHKTASIAAETKGVGHITQLDMSIAQFGFMGLVVIRPKLIGIHNFEEEDLEAFVHMWRVIGYLFGLNDRYNLCCKDIDETKQACEAVLNNILAPHFEQLSPDFLHMSSSLLDGMWCMNPFIQTNVFLAYIFYIIGKSDGALRLSFWRRLHLHFVMTVVTSLRYSFIKSFCNENQYLALWLMKRFPFLAYYKFGYNQSYVKILGDM